MVHFCLGPKIKEQKRHVELPLKISARFPSSDSVALQYGDKLLSCIFLDGEWYMAEGFRRREVLEVVFYTFNNLFIFMSLNNN